jgi:hypothetical protein
MLMRTYFVCDGANGQVVATDTHTLKDSADCGGGHEVGQDADTCAQFGWKGVLAA